MSVLILEEEEKVVVVIVLLRGSRPEARVWCLYRQGVAEFSTLVPVGQGVVILFGS